MATRRPVSGEAKTKQKGKRWKNRRGRKGNEVRECPAQPGCQDLSRKGLITIPGGGWEEKSRMRCELAQDLGQ